MSQNGGYIQKVDIFKNGLEEGCHVIFDGGIDIPVVKYLSFMLFVKRVTFSVV